jgi:hypothetical protein
MQADHRPRPVWLLFDPPKSPDGLDETVVGELARLQGNEALRCAVCGHVVTDADARTAVDGSFDHVFRNPHGLSFHIGCFRHAPGCVVTGEPTLEWTWFPRHAWCVALCAGCHVHLGWRYDGPDGVFFGLILNRLRFGGAECLH